MITGNQVNEVIHMNGKQTIIVLLGILIMCGTAFSGCITSSNTAPASPQNVTSQPSRTVAMTGDIVSVYYIGMLEDGTVFNSNVNDTPLTFTVGNASVIDGIRDAVIGMAEGDEKTVTIPFDKAYGPYRSELVRLVPRMGPLENKTFTVGQYITITRKTDNAVSVVKILNVTRDTVTWDENNPLAGKNLTYVIKMVTLDKK
ncbi:MAG: FKBP-type peptidyl-prolyl cis-trans isomerase [Methanoregula sp.]|jgi:peptidylprolyl isomerase|nr:FKBP-type peptidyl-prolyl cis-trans isomerase [Methanoregula sp.]